MSLCLINCFKIYFKIGIIRRRHAFCQQDFSIIVLCFKQRKNDKTLIDWYLSVKTINNIRFKYSQLKTFFLALLKEIKQRISSYISLALTIINMKVILRELLGLLNLSRAQTFYIYKLTKVIVICQNKHLFFTIFKIVLLSFKSLNNS